MRIKVKPDEGRAIIDNSSSGMTITIPFKRNWFLIVFLAAWLGGWAIGWITHAKRITSGELSGYEYDQLYLWLIGWTFGGIVVIFVLLFCLGWRESVTVSNASLNIKKSIFGFGLSKVFDMDAIGKLYDANPSIGQGFVDGFNPFQTVNSSNISFEYGMQKYSFGSGLDEAEVRYILNQILERFPQLNNRGNDQESSKSSSVS